MSTLFDLAFWSAAPFWALMILAPAWSWTKRIVASPLIVLPTLVVWAVAAVPLLGPLWTAVTNPSLDGLRELLGDPGAVTLVWAQVIAWDLFIGRWMYLDSRERGIHPLLMGPLLMFTVLLSPIGLPVYFALRLRRPRPTVGVWGLGRARQSDATHRGGFGGLGPPRQWGP